MKRLLATVLMALILLVGAANVVTAWVSGDSGVAHAGLRIVRPCDPGLESDDPF